MNDPTASELDRARRAIVCTWLPVGTQSPWHRFARVGGRLISLCGRYVHVTAPEIDPDVKRVGHCKDCDAHRRAFLRAKIQRKA